jgi:hypothetical protein
MTIKPRDGVLLEDVPFFPDVEKLRVQLRVRPGSEFERNLLVLVEEAAAIGRPKAWARPAFIDSRGEDCLVLAGVELTSRVLSVNLASVQRAFPFVTTCGLELAEWAGRKTDMLERYWADALCEAALDQIGEALKEALDERYAPGRLSSMCPGSLPDWPLTEQTAIFALLGPGASKIGVRLTDSMLMTPVKSVSGLFFAGETDFHSCRLCSRERCPKRRAPYAEGLMVAGRRP